jgi:hypothetical protein
MILPEIIRRVGAVRMVEVEEMEEVFGSRPQRR